MKHSLKGLGPYVLLVLGLLQMTADLLNLPGLKAVAAATLASPAPKVFSSINGLETFSTTFSLQWVEKAGTVTSVPITSEIYARLQGPYNRRNVYGAVLAYGPVLASNPATQRVYASVLRHALCGEAPLLRELGFEPPTPTQRIRLNLEPVPGTSMGNLPRLLEPLCK